MSSPERRQVRVRRSPRIGVFLLLGAVAGALVALIAVLVTPPDPSTPTPQALGFFVLLLAPLGALLGGLVAIVLEGRAVRSARTLDAEREGARREAAASQEPAPEEGDPAARAEDPPAAREGD